MKAYWSLSDAILNPGCWTQSYKSWQLSYSVIVSNFLALLPSLTYGMEMFTLPHYTGSCTLAFDFIDAHHYKIMVSE